MLARLIDFRHSFGTQADKIIRRTPDGSAHGFQKCHISIRPEHLADAPEELSMAVVLHQRIHSITVHHAGDESVIALELHIPDQEIPQRVSQSGLGKGGSHDHAVAHPGTRVSARPRLDRRTIAVDENVCRRRVETGERLARAAGHLPFHGPENFLPVGMGVIPSVFCWSIRRLEKRHGNGDFENRLIVRDFPSDRSRCET